ncbi:hypothetical protein Tco_1074304 [Tanacetum coccineum]
MTKGETSTQTQEQEIRINFDSKQGKQEKLHSFYSSKIRQARVDKKETGGKQETAIDEKAENKMKECTNWKDKKKDKEQEALLISEDSAFVITGENIGPKPNPESPKRFTRGDAKRQAEYKNAHQHQQNEAEDDEDVKSISSDDVIVETKKKGRKSKGKKEGKKMKKSEEETQMESENDVLYEGSIVIMKGCMLVRQRRSKKGQGKQNLRLQDHT